MKRWNVLTELRSDGVNTEVTFVTEEGWTVVVEAKCDTGAASSSMDSRLAELIGAEYTGTTVKVNNANGTTKRKIAIASFECNAGEFESRFTISDRGGLSTPVILGRDLLFLEEQYNNNNNTINKKYCYSKKERVTRTPKLYAGTKSIHKVGLSQCYVQLRIELH